MQEKTVQTTLNATANEVMVSTTTFWFWYPEYDAERNIDLIRTLDLDVDGLDIWLFVTEGYQAPEWSEQVGSHIGTYKHRTFHTDFFDLDWTRPIDVAAFTRRLKELQKTGDRYGVQDVVIHADFLLRDRPFLLDLLRNTLPRMRISFETMDSTKSFGKKPDDFSQIFSIDKTFGLVPDVAHLTDCRLGSTWMEFFCNPDLASHIRFVHVSVHSSDLGYNYYKGQGFPEIDARHAFVQAGEHIISDMLDYAMCYPMVLEGIVPPGEGGVRLLRDEISLLKYRVNREKNK